MQITVRFGDRSRSQFTETTIYVGREFCSAATFASTFQMRHVIHNCPAPIITTMEPNISGTIVFIPDMRLSDSLGDLSDVNWAGIGETIAQSRITDSPAATSTISVLAATMDVDDAIGQSASATTTSTEDEDDATNANVSRLSTPGGDIIADPTLDADADLLDQILGVCTTPP